MLTLLRGGHVCDPASGTNEVADVLVRDDRVAAVGALGAVPDARVVDVRGLVVGPGFVDLHSHVHSVAGQRLQALDGVTTALDLEAGLMPVARAYAAAARAGRPLNYGFSASWASARAQVLLGFEPDATFESGVTALGMGEWQRSSSGPELRRWLSLLERELADGALGIGVLLGYAPRTDPAEFLAVARVAAAAGAPTFTHVRDLVEFDPDIPVDGSSELVVAAGETGAAMHHCHVNSTSLRHVDRVLATLGDARAAGSRITVEAYPYGSGATAIGAAFLAPELLGARTLEPASLVLMADGRRVRDAAELAEIRRADPGAWCIVDFLDERDDADVDVLRAALAFDDTIVASDAMPIVLPDGAADTLEWPLPPDAATHPRTTGTFSKSLRMMVREASAWSWYEAFRRCSYLPAEVLAANTPAMRTKGRLDDADLVVLDPAEITETATYTATTRPARGVRHLMVNGTFVVHDGELDVNAFPGRPVRGAPR